MRTRGVKDARVACSLMRGHSIKPPRQTRPCHAVADAHTCLKDARVTRSLMRAHPIMPPRQTRPCHAFADARSWPSGCACRAFADARAGAAFWRVAPGTGQVRIEGVITELPESDAEAYFASRPRRAQLCSAASPQSQVVKDRAELEGYVDALAEQTGEGAVAKPAHWGGYTLSPDRVECWQGRDGRLHDRFQFVRQGVTWQVDRLAP